jgi:hypothetical protein
VFGVAAATSAPPPPASSDTYLSIEVRGDPKRLGDGANRVVQGGQRYQDDLLESRPNPAIQANPIHRSSEGCSLEKHRRSLAWQSRLIEAVPQLPGELANSRFSQTRTPGSPRAQLNSA